MKNLITTGTTGCTAQISVKKINANETIRLTKVTTHNKRTGKTEDHVDERRTSFNEMLVGKEDDDLYCSIVKRILGPKLKPKEIHELSENEIRYQDGAKVRKDAVLAFECKCQYPGELMYANIDEHGQIYLIPEGEEIDPRPVDIGGRGDFLYPVNREEFEAWKELTLLFVAQRFGGNQNILQAVCHMDETIPHLHIIGTPFYRDQNNIERLSMKNYLNGRMETSELQTEYAAAVSELGYIRGECKGYDVNCMTATRARALMGQAIGAAPQTPEEYKELVANMTAKEGMEMLQALYLKVAINDEMTKEIPRLESVIRRKSKENEHLRKELSEKSAENEALTKQLATYQKEHLRRVCELLGAQLLEDRELVDAYFQTQDKITDLGVRNFEHGGLKIDLECGEHLRNVEISLGENSLNENRE